jgi:hypothetical protein
MNPPTSVRTHFDFDMQAKKKDTRTNAERMDSLRAYKVRHIESGTYRVVIPVQAAVGRTYLYLSDKGTPTYSCDPEYLNSAYEFLGPLEAGETVRIVGG